MAAAARDARPAAGAIAWSCPIAPREGTSQTAQDDRLQRRDIYLGGQKEQLPALYPSQLSPFRETFSSPDPCDARRHDETTQPRAIGRAPPAASSVCCAAEVFPGPVPAPSARPPRSGRAARASPAPTRRFASASPTRMPRCVPSAPSPSPSPSPRIRPGSRVEVSVPPEQSASPSRSIDVPPAPRLALLRRRWSCAAA